MPRIVIASGAKPSTDVARYPGDQSHFITKHGLLPLGRTRDKLHTSQ